MINRLEFLFIGTCLTILVPVSSAQAQTFDIEELPVLSEQDGQFSYGTFINQWGHVVGQRPGHAFLWNGSRAIDFGAQADSTLGSGLNDLDQVIGNDGGLPGIGFFWDGKSVVPLGFIPESLNNLGQVAGRLGGRAVLWSAKSGTQDLGFLPGGGFAVAHHVNERGHVAGLARAADFTTHGFFWSEETGMVDVGPLNSSNGITDLNDLDQMVAVDGAFPCRITMTIAPDGSATVVREALPTLGPPDDPFFGIPTGINNAGQAVGFTGSRVVMWDTDGALIANEDTIYPLGTPPLINDSGHVAFRGAADFSSPLRAYFWNPATGVTVQLPTLAGDFTEPRSINERDEITGSSLTPDGNRAVVWRPTGPLPEGSVEILALMELVRTLLGDDRIFAGDAVSLMAKLTAADNQLRAGNALAAIGVLSAAQNQIEQLIRNDFIGTQTGEQLLSAIAIIIELL